MSWTDNKSIEVFKYLRDKFKIKTLVETGTFMGINAKLHSKNFREVFTCELVKEYLEKAKRRLRYIPNVHLFHEDSPTFLKAFIQKYKKSGSKEIIIFYLDAHFYNPLLPKNKRFVVLDELKALKNFKKGIIIIHDFDNGLGHITYDGIPLDLNLIEKDLMKVNTDFHLYTNELSSCDIVKIEEIPEAGLEVDYDTYQNLRYAWKTPRLTYRGILYALPKELNKKELKNLGLKKL